MIWYSSIIRLHKKINFKRSDNEFNLLDGFRYNLSLWQGMCKIIMTRNVHPQVYFVGKGDWYLELNAGQKDQKQKKYGKTRKEIYKYIHSYLRLKTCKIS